MIYKYEIIALQHHDVIMVLLCCDGMRLLPYFVMMPFYYDIITL